MAKKALYVLTCVDCFDSHVASVEVYPTKEEAQAAMREAYRFDFKDLVDGGFDEEDVEACSECQETEAYIGLDLIDNPYRWEINIAEIEL